MAPYGLSSVSNVMFNPFGTVAQGFARWFSCNNPAANPPGQVLAYSSLALIATVVFGRVAAIASAKARWRLS
jgi:hypothetical protein